MGFLRLEKKESRILPRKGLTCKAIPISEVFNCYSWLGKRCFILCGGPSLGGFDFSTIQNECTIGINKSFLYYDTDIVYAMDLRFYDSISMRNRCRQESKDVCDAWSRFKGVKVFLRNDNKGLFDPSIYVVQAIEKRLISLDVSVGIHGGKCSGFGGMMLAISMGCKEIYMLGLDLKIDEKRKKTHWHEGYSYQSIDNVKKVLLKFKEEFENFSLNIKELGISVINLNPDSALNCFPKKDIREIL